MVLYQQLNVPGSTTNYPPLLQDTKNRYDMFEEFMSQSSSELAERNQSINNLLQESNTKNCMFRDKQRGCLNELMELVVKGLDTAVLNRDTQHGMLTKDGRVETDHD